MYKKAYKLNLSGDNGAVAEYSADGEVPDKYWSDDSLGGKGQWKFTYTNDDGESHSVELPANIINFGYAKQIYDDENRDLSKIDLGKLFLDRRLVGVTPGNMGEKAKDLSPETVASLRNALITLRASLIKDRTNELRASGRNLQAFAIENKDKLISTGIGLGAGGLGYMSAYSGLGLSPWFKKHKAVRLLTSLLAGAGAGVTAGLLTNKYLTRHYTPSEKAKAGDLVATIGSTIQEGGEVLGLAGH